MSIDLYARIKETNDIGKYKIVCLPNPQEVPSDAILIGTYESENQATLEQEKWEDFHLNSMNGQPNIDNKLDYIILKLGYNNALTFTRLKGYEERQMQQLRVIARSRNVTNTLEGRIPDKLPENYFAKTHR